MMGGDTGAEDQKKRESVVMAGFDVEDLGLRELIEDASNDGAAGTREPRSAQGAKHCDPQAALC